MNVSLVIPTYNRGKTLCNTLEMFVKDESIMFEIIIVDQSDKAYPRLIDLTIRYKDKIRYFSIKKKGLPHARNYGISKAAGDIVIFCDDDVIPQNGFVCSHVKNYGEKDVGCVGGRVVTGNNNNTNDDKRTLKIGSFREFDGRLTDNFNGKVRQNIDHVQGCNMSFRKELVLMAGGFDERFGGSAHLEETDLCMRIRNMGYKIVFEPSAELIHLKSPEGGCRAEDYRQWFYWFGHNYMLFFLKNCKRIFLFPFILLRIIWLILSAIKRSNLMIIIWGMQGYLAGAATFIKVRNNTLNLH